MSRYVKRRRIIPINTDLKGPLKVKVGFPAGMTDGGTIDIAIWNHYGTSRGIPPRPFLLNAIRGNDHAFRSALGKIAAKFLRGETTLEIEMRKLGVFAQGKVQQEIVTGGFTPNAASTIEAKGSSRPLIDTGEMRQKVTWKVSR